MSYLIDDIKVVFTQDVLAMARPRFTKNLTTNRKRSFMLSEWSYDYVLS